MSRQELLNIVKTIVEGINPYVDISDEMDLLEEGVLDSLGIVLLMQEIHDRTGIDVNPENAEIDDFKTVASIVELIIKNGG